MDTDSVSNGAISGWTKSKMVSADILEISVHRCTVLPIVISERTTSSTGLFFFAVALSVIMKCDDYGILEKQYKAQRICNEFVTDEKLNIVIRFKMLMTNETNQRKQKNKRQMKHKQESCAIAKMTARCALYK